VTADPYREHRCALLVRAQTAAGRRARALASVQRACKVLVEHLNPEPGAELVGGRAGCPRPAISIRPSASSTPLGVTSGWDGRTRPPETPSPR
jgi:hypothetical protein